MTTLALPDDPSIADLCTSCETDRMGCDIKAGLGGKACCDKFTHHERKAESR